MTSQLIQVLQNLISCMDTSAAMLKKCNRQDKAEELNGARSMVEEWVRSIEDENNRPIVVLTKYEMQNKELVKSFESGGYLVVEIK